MIKMELSHSSDIWRGKALSYTKQGGRMLIPSNFLSKTTCCAVAGMKKPAKYKSRTDRMIIDIGLFFRDHMYWEQLFLQT
jgi:hypothetical protein